MAFLDFGVPNKLAHERDALSASANGEAVAIAASNSGPALAVLSWAAVGIPLAIGILITLQKAVVLFQ